MHQPDDETVRYWNQLKHIGKISPKVLGEDVPADVSDQATQEETFALRLRARDREHKLINKIDDSIQAIDNGEYGYCEECGVEIGIRRLEARPTATLCIDCKTLAEVREKQGR